MTGRRKKVLFALLFLAFVGLVALSNVWKSSLTVARVTVIGNRIVETNEILQLAHVERGMPMYDVDLMLVQQHVMSNFFIKNAIVERDLPSTVKITVVERIPIVMLNRGEISYMDDEGVVLPHSISREVFDLPLLSGVPAGLKLKAGVTITHPDVREALQVLRTAKLVSKELYHMISEIHLRGGGDIVLYAAEGGVPILFGRGNAPSKLVLLQTFWNEVVRTRGVQHLQYVDLRFDDQVVVRWNTPTTKTTM